MDSYEYTGPKSTGNCMHCNHWKEPTSHEQLLRRDVAHSRESDIRWCTKHETITLEGNHCPQFELWEEA